MKRNIHILACIILLALEAGAQDLRETDDKYQDAIKALLDRKTDAETYEKLYEACDTYRNTLATSPKDSPVYSHSREKLLNSFSLLGEAAVYFTEENDEERTFKFAKAFVDITMMDGIYSEDIVSRQGYAQFPFFLADRANSDGKYEEAIMYYRLYLQTGDQEMCKDAYEQVTSCLYALKNYDETAGMAAIALKKYPGNQHIVNLGINSCLEGQLDDQLQPFLDLAGTLEPGKKELRKLQAELYERQQDYGKALETFQGHHQDYPDSVYKACHLGANYYNLGVQLYDEAALMPTEGDAKQAEDQARQYFGKAIPYLGNVVAMNSLNPNFVLALAQCHNMLGDYASLERENKSLKNLKARTVRKGDKPSLLKNYNCWETAIDRYLLADASDVDVDVPQARKPGSNADTYAIIFGNENYRHVGKVSYAHNDANSFAEYCRKLLGIPEKNIRLQKDATKNEMERYLGGIAERARMQPGKLNFIIYYAGHGLPDVEHGTSYLVPSDADSNIGDCYSLSELYDHLDKAEARSITIFLDACFSGASRNGGSVLDDRFFYVSDQGTNAKGKTVSFCAASGKETALPYNEQLHGLFTYVLLKNLKETKGDITLGELADTLQTEVDKLAFDLKNKHQRPQTNASSSISDSWRDMKLP